MSLIYPHLVNGCGGCCRRVEVCGIMGFMCW